MAVPRSTLERRRRQERLRLVAVASARRAWAQMGAEFDVSWPLVGPRLFVLLAAAQLNAATNGADSVTDVLVETGQLAPLAAAVAPRRFAGVASDGRDLRGLLYGAVTTAKRYVANGSAPREALAHGGRWLDTAVATQVSDAFRGGTGVAIAARPRVEGYARALTPPSCPRCAILAGRWYRWDAAFDRHLRCDCSQIPVSERASGDYRTDPDKAYAAGQITGLTIGEQEVLKAGADISRVVNSRRGASGIRALTTTELGGRRGDGRSRLTPEGVYAQAATRDEAIRLLIQNGYLL